MERSSMDAVGSRVVRRQGRVGKLAVVVAVQNVLVAVCLLVTLYVYFKFHAEKISEDIVHIQFGPTSVSTENAVVAFMEIVSSKNVTVNAEKTKIHFYSTGPYVWHMNACYKSMDGVNTTGTLLLKVEGSETPVGSFELTTPTEVCRWLYSIVYLKADQEASLHFLSKAGFKVKNVTMGLSYMLGKKCQHYQ